MRPEFSKLLSFCKGIRNWQCEGNPMEIRIINGRLFKMLRKVAPKKFTQNAMAYALGVNTHNLSKFELNTGKIKSIPFNPLMIDEYIVRVNEYLSKGQEYFKENKNELTSPKRVPNDKYVKVEADESVWAVIPENPEIIKLSDEDEEIVKKLYEVSEKYISDMQKLFEHPFENI